MTINQRIKFLFSVTNTKAIVFGKKFELSRQQASSICKNSGIGRQTIEKLLIYFPSLNARWLILEEGEMFNVDSDSILNEPEAQYGQNSRDIALKTTIEILKKELDIKNKQIESFLRQLESK